MAIYLLKMGKMFASSLYATIRQNSVFRGGNRGVVQEVGDPSQENKELVPEVVTSRYIVIISSISQKMIAPKREMNPK